MLIGGEARHVGADFGEEGLGKGGADAVHGNQVNAGDAEEVHPGGEGGAVFGAGVFFDGWEVWELRGNIPAGFDGGEVAFNFGVTGIDEGGEIIKELQGLAEDKEELVIPRTGKGFGDGLLG
jgi:hypothetical protein